VYEHSFGREHRKDDTEERELFRQKLAYHYDHHRELIIFSFIFANQVQLEA